jgi:hypothetical protein
MTSPVPSRTDLVEANYPGVLSLIVGFSPRIELRAWRLVYGSHGLAVRFDPVPLILGCRVEKSPLGLLSSAGTKEECAEIQ